MDDASPEGIATQYEQTAAELDQAAQHLRTSAQHVRDRAGVGIGAHAFGALAICDAPTELLEQLAITHASRSRPG